MKHLRDNYPVLDIEVDGGVGPATIDTAAEVNLSGHLVNITHGCPATLH